MLLRELFEAQAKQIVAVMPGGFHPFHPGHKSLYDWAVKTFGKDNVYVAATNDTATRPFPFEVKKKLAAMAGVPENNFIQVKSPFNAMSYKDIVDDNTALVFVRSQKDKNEQPLPDQIKKNGEPGYLRTYTGKDLEPSNVAGYMAYGPTIDFDFSGMQIKSASELRSTWPNMSDEDKLKAAKLMYGNGAEAAVQLLNKALGAVEEGWKDKLAAAGLAGAMALGSGAANARVSPDQDPGINRLTGKPNVVQQAEPSDSKSDFKTQAAKGYSKEYLEKAADPNRVGRYLISVEKAQELLDKMNGEVEEPSVAEGMFGIDAKTKGAIQNVVSNLSDIPGMWDHAAQTFTDKGMDNLKSVLKNNTKHIKYAVNLTADDFEADESIEEILGFATKRPKTVTITKRRPPEEDSVQDKIKKRRAMAAKGDANAFKSGKVAEGDIEETIRKVKGGYRLYSKDGKKNLGTFDTRAGAEKHEREVQYFKHKG